MWKLRLWLNPVHVEVPEGVVELYGTSWCGYCANARRFFDANGIPFADLDIERSPAAEQAFQQLGGRGVPLIRVGDEIKIGRASCRDRGQNAAAGGRGEHSESR